MSTERIIYGAHALESVKSYKLISQIIETLKNQNIKYIDTAPTYDLGYINKYIGSQRNEFEVIYKVSLLKLPRTWVPTRLFPLFKRIFNRKYIRYIFNFIFTFKKLKSEDLLSHKKSLMKGLKDCNKQNFYSYLFHEDTKYGCSKDISKFLNLSMEKGLTKNIGISLHGDYTIDELNNLIKNNPWISALQLPIESDRYSFEDIVGLVNKNENINFAIRGFYKAYRKKVYKQIKKFIMLSKSNSKVVFSTTKNQRIIELVNSLK